MKIRLDVVDFLQYSCGIEKLCNVRIEL